MLADYIIEGNPMVSIEVYSVVVMIPLMKDMKLNSSSELE